MSLQVFDNGDLPTDNYGRILAFGHTGAGKSTLGSTMPGNRIVLAADANASAPLARTLADVPRVYTPKGAVDHKPAVLLRVSTWADVDQAMSWVEANQARKSLYSLVIDSLTAIGEMCQAEILGVSGKSAMTTDKRLDKRDFGTIFMRLDGLRHRAHKLPMHVLWLCGVKSVHTRPEDDKSPRIYTPDLVGQAAERFPSNCVASLFLETKRGVRQLRARPDDEVNAKDNTGLLPPVVPADMELILFRMGFGHSAVMDYPAIREASKSSFIIQSTTTQPAKPTVRVAPKPAVPSK